MCQPSGIALFKCPGNAVNIGIAPLIPAVVEYYRAGITDYPLPLVLFKVILGKDAGEIAPEINGNHQVPQYFTLMEYRKVIFVPVTVRLKLIHGVHGGYSLSPV